MTEPTPPGTQVPPRAPTSGPETRHDDPPVAQTAVGGSLRSASHAGESNGGRVGGAEQAVHEVLSGRAGKLDDVTTHNGFRAQLQRARRLQTQQTADAVVCPPEPPVISRAARVRERDAELRLPPPREATLTRTAKLDGGGRLKVAVEVRDALGWTPATDLQVSVHGAQLLVTDATRDDAPAGATATLDPHGRLQVTAGQRRLLGVAAGATVLMFADVEGANLRITDPARVHALLDELVPLVVPESEAASDPTSGVDATVIAIHRAGAHA